MKRTATALIALGLAGGQAQAQTPEEIELYKKMTIFSVGAAVAINDEPYEDFNGGSPNILAVPFYVYNKNNLTLAGPNISYRFWKPAGIQLSAEGKYRFQNYDASDSDYLAGMDGRNGTFELGLRAGKRIGRLRLRVDGMFDVAGQHDGHELQAFANVELGNGRMISFRPMGGVSYLSENFTNYYYGVRAEEARAELLTEDGLVARPFYQPDGTLVPFAGAEARIRISRRIQLNGQVKTAFLPEEITDSAIVGANNRTSAFIGLSYSLSGPGVKKGQWF
jgi:outer membrane protein